ncbi:hypothetical protein ABK040_002415 [Willaertia magna]
MQKNTKENALFKKITTFQPTTTTNYHQQQQPPPLVKGSRLNAISKPPLSKAVPNRISPINNNSRNPSLQQHNNATTINNNVNNKRGTSVSPSKKDTFKRVTLTLDSESNFQSFKESVASEREKKWNDRFSTSKIPKYDATKDRFCKIIDNNKVRTTNKSKPTSPSKRRIMSVGNKRDTSTDYDKKQYESQLLKIKEDFIKQIDEKEEKIQQLRVDIKQKDKLELKLKNRLNELNIIISKLSQEKESLKSQQNSTKLIKIPTVVFGKREEINEETKLQDGTLYSPQRSEINNEFTKQRAQHLTDENQKLKEKLEEDSGIIRNLKDKLSIIDDYEAKIKELATELEKEKEKNKKLILSNEGIIHQLDQLKNSNAIQLKQIEELESIIVSYGIQIENLHLELSNFKDGGEKQEMDLKKEIKDNVVLISNLTIENENLKKELSSLKELQGSDTTKRIQELELRCNILSESNGLLLDRLKKFETGVLHSD